MWTNGDGGKRSWPYINQIIADQIWITNLWTFYTVIFPTTFLSARRQFTSTKVNFSSIGFTLSEKVLLCLILPPATKLGQGYVFTGVCDSVNRGGRGCLTPPKPTPTPPRDQHPPGPTPPSWPTPPLTNTPPEQTHPHEHAVRYGQRAGGTHPTGMQSCEQCM